MAYTPNYTAVDTSPQLFDLLGTVVNELINGDAPISIIVRMGLMSMMLVLAGVVLLKLVKMLPNELFE